jgi:hypothetical protein
MPTLINQGKIEMSVQDHVGSSMNDSGTCEKIDTPLTQRRSLDVHRELLVKRNLAEQSKWLNDDTGDRSWAKHETQQIAWMMGVQLDTGMQVVVLARGK